MLGKTKYLLVDKGLDKVISFVGGFLLMIIGSLSIGIKSDANNIELFSDSLKLIITKRNIEISIIIIGVIIFVLGILCIGYFIRRMVYASKQKNQSEVLLPFMAGGTPINTEFFEFENDNIGYIIKLYGEFVDVDRLACNNILPDELGNEEVETSKKQSKCMGHIDCHPTFFYNYKYSCSSCDYEFKSKFNSYTLKRKCEDKINASISKYKIINK